MKQKDVALILIIVFVSGVLSFVISNKFISSPKHELKAAHVDPIVSDFKQPDNKYFNDQSINPTKTITIDNNANPTPIKPTDK